MPASEPAPDPDAAAESAETGDPTLDCFPFCREPEPIETGELQPGQPPGAGNASPAQPESDASPKD